MKSSLVRMLPILSVTIVLHYSCVFACLLSVVCWCSLSVVCWLFVCCLSACLYGVYELTALHRYGYYGVYEFSCSLVTSMVVLVCEHVCTYTHTPAMPCHATCLCMVLGCHCTNQHSHLAILLIRFVVWVHTVCSVWL